MRKGILLALVLAGLLLRVIDLSNHPAGFTPDEASFGYDAYSLLHTGKDQWGNSWPLVLKSFGDDKLPLYTYLAIPSIAIFGLNEFAVRLPNALVGTLAILATYYLLKQSKLDSKVIMFSVILLAFSPWHIPLSRGAFEANLTTLFLPLGILSFIKGVENSKYYYLASISFGLNMFSYHSARLITPLMIIGLLLIYRKNLRINFTSVTAGLLALLFTLIAGVALLNGSSRVSTSSIMSEKGYQQSFYDRYDAVLAGLPNAASSLINNKYVWVPNTVIQRYVEYFSIPFYWTNGPAEGTYGMMPGFGILYWFESLFLFGFIVYLFQKKLSSTHKWLILWLLLAPIPAALSIGPGYAANRAAIMLPAIHIASAIGGILLLEKVGSAIKINKNALNVGMGLVFIASSIFFLEEYFYQQPLNQGGAMIFGVRESFDKLSKLNCNANQILIDKRMSEPHIYTAFYNKVDPSIFQEASKSWNFKEQGLDWVDQLGEYKLGNYTFKEVNPTSVANDYKNVILVTNSQENLPSAEVIRSADMSIKYQIICVQ